MNILYYSVHHILEDDEVRLFQELGHNVFCLGTNNRHGTSQPFRPAIRFSPAELHIADIYESLGGTYFASDTPDAVLPPGFVEHFSLVIVMHSAEFIATHWPKLRHRPVIWRTIGQGVDAFEDVLRPYRRQGLHIVRYSPVETKIARSLGEDAVIRFYKDADAYGGWTGRTPHVLSFANFFAQRYPREAADYRELAEHLPCALGGMGNEGIPQSRGFVEAGRQVELYASARAYLYMTGLEVPYTLNFMEAWLTGAPVIVYAPQRHVGPYFEIDELVRDGENGFVCRDKAEVIDRANALFDDADLAARIGAAGRRSAAACFSKQRIAREWQALLTGLDRYG